MTRSTRLGFVASAACVAVAAVLAVLSAGVPSAWPEESDSSASRSPRCRLDAALGRATLESRWLLLTLDARDGRVVSLESRLVSSRSDRSAPLRLIGAVDGPIALRVVDDGEWGVAPSDEIQVGVACLPDARLEVRARYPSGEVMLQTWGLAGGAHVLELSADIGEARLPSRHLALSIGDQLLTCSDCSVPLGADHRSTEPTPGVPFTLASGAGSELRADERGPGDGADWRNTWRGARAGPFAVAVRTSAPIDPAARDPRTALAYRAGSALTAEVYLGPIEATTLGRADRALTALVMRDHVWPIRALGRVLHQALAGLVWLVGDVAFAVILLSIFVKIAMLPLTQMADRWQMRVTRIETELAPAIQQIRGESRGAERSQRILALYRARGVHPLFALRSLAGVALQIPVWLAVFHMLEESPRLVGASFLWVDDLSQPDTVAALVSLSPSLGSVLHLLPLIMTGFALVAARLHTASESGDASAPSRRGGLYGMAGLFLVALYAFPAGVVLYWAQSNALSCAIAAWRALFEISTRRLRVDSTPALG